MYFPILLCNKLRYNTEWCAEQRVKKKCNRQGVTYEIRCTTCDDEYVGETARSAYTRGVEHKEALEKRDEKSAQ